VGAPAAALEPGRLDVAVRVEAPEARIDERTRNRPDAADFRCGLEELREPPTVARPLHEQRDDAELIRGQFGGDPGILIGIGSLGN
jgi:hypothetical protein